MHLVKRRDGEAFIEKKKRALGENNKKTSAYTKDLELD